MKKNNIVFSSKQPQNSVSLEAQVVTFAINCNKMRGRIKKERGGVRGWDDKEGWRGEERGGKGTLTET